MAEAEQASSVVRAVRRVPQWVGELSLVAVMYVIYEFGRGLHQGSPKAADHTAHHLLRWEQVVHLDPEKWLTVSLDKVTALAVPAAYFYASFHYIVTPAVLIWLYVKHRSAYGPARTWLAISTLIGLIIFQLLPTAPPRLLHLGYPDVLADVSSYGWWGSAGSAPRGLGHLTNQLAAMPSMHFGWALFCGVLIWRHAARTWVRTLGVVYPILTGVIVLSTGNHYLLDLVGGALVMAAGWGSTVLLRRSAGRLHALLTTRHEARVRAAEMSTISERAVARETVDGDAVATKAVTVDARPDSAGLTGSRSRPDLCGRPTD